MTMTAWVLWSIMFVILTIKTVIVSIMYQEMLRLRARVVTLTSEIAVLRDHAKINVAQIDQMQKDTNTARRTITAAPAVGG